nr:metal ABC transporter permease [Pseudooceanicola aestuarii]
MATATPERMAGIAALVGLASALGGLALSWHLDSPAGPTIIVAAAGFYALTRLRG